MVRSCSLSSSSSTQACVVVNNCSRSLLIGNTFSGCQRLGILVDDKAHAAIHGNVFKDNFCGICISSEASVAIAENQLRHHRVPAITFMKQAQGVLQGNTFEDNKGGGISVIDAAQPHIQGNTFRGHTMPAIAYRGTAAGRVQGNEFDGNEGIGIWIAGSACPVVEDNQLCKNRRAADVIEFMANGETIKAKIVSKRDDAPNGLNHELAFIGEKPGREWVAMDEKRSVIQNLRGKSGMSYEVKERVGKGSFADGEGGLLLNVSSTKGVKRAAIAVTETSEAVVRHNVLDG